MAKKGIELKWSRAMWLNLIKGIVSAIIIVTVTAVGNRYPRGGAPLLSLPVSDGMEFYDLMALLEPPFTFAGESLILGLVGWAFGFFVRGRASGWKWATIAISIR